MSAKRDDEVQLWSLFGEGALFKWPREAAESIGMPDRRLQYLCLKWARQGVYDYGTAHDLGWKQSKAFTRDAYRSE